MFLRKKCKISPLPAYFRVLYDKICQVIAVASIMKKMRSQITSVVAMAQ